MTWPRYLEILEYWQRVPPLAECVAGFTGALGKPTTPDTSADENTDLLKDLLAAGFALPPGFDGP